MLAFCSYFIRAGRYALDCKIMLNASILAITFLFHYLQKPTIPALLWCGGGFVLVLYSNTFSYLTIPVFWAAISLYILYTNVINIKRLMLLACEICVLGLPIILFVICLIFGLSGFCFLSTNIAPIAAHRVYEFAEKEFWPAFINCIKYTLTNDGNMLDTVPKFYTMYVISVPFIVELIPTKEIDKRRNIQLYGKD